MRLVTVITHPLVQHNLTRVRDRNTEPQEFRRLLGEIASLMIYEATRSLRVKKITVRTPLENATGSTLEREIVLVPVLRAGLGMLGSIMDIIPHARVGFIGLKREESTLRAHFYHKSLPKDLGRREVILIDPMLATGGSGSAAATFLKAAGVTSMKFVCLVAAPEGIERLGKAHPDVEIWTAAIDEKLNDHGYIVPGLGDAGARMFGTK